MHAHLTNTEVSQIETFNAHNDSGLVVGYSPRKRVFTLKDASGRVIDSNPEVFDLIDSAESAEQNRVTCYRCAA